MDMDFMAAEVTLQYKTQCQKKGKAMSAREAYDILVSTFREGTIDYKEYAKVLYLNQANEVVAYNTVSEGGITETAIDIRLVLQGALLTNATQVLLAHNHPSGNLKPSPQDNMITQRLKKACEIMRIHLVDHLIITSTGYYSYREEGRI
jgi:DNA repair protein RadC